MFPEKIEFDGKTYRTNSYNKVLDLIYQGTNKLRGEEKKSGESFSTFSASVPRPGVEPGWKWIHWCLRPARLPIPPSGHAIDFSIAVQRYEFFRYRQYFDEKNQEKTENILQTFVVYKI